MSSQVLVKPIIAIGTTGGIVGGAYLASPYLFSQKKEIPTTKKEDNSTIGDHINSLNLKLISSLEQSKVAKQWEEEFELDEANIKASIPEATTWEKFKDWCNKSLQLKKSENENLVNNVKKWCTIGTIEDRISRKKDKTLISEQGADTDWDKIYTDNNENTDRKAIGLEETKGDDSKKTSDIEKIMNFCKGEKKKEFLVVDNKDSFNKVEKWCTKQVAV